jgi:MFS family permease
LSIGGSGVDVGDVTTVALVSLVVFLLLGGTVADRLPRHRVLTAANALQGLAQAGAACLVLTGTAHIWELIALSAVRGTGTGFYLPASSGLLPQTVPADQLARANAIYRVGRNSAQIGGTAPAGALAGLAGAGWGVTASAVGYTIAATLRLGMHFPAESRSASTGILHELREGWHEFASRRWLWSMVLQFAVVEAASAATLSVLGPIVADHSLGGAISWGFIMAVYGAGSVAGGLVMIRLQPVRLLRVANAGVLIYSLLLFALAVPLPFPLVAVSAFIAGAGGEVFNVSWAVSMQQEIPPGALSRVSAYDALGSFALAPVGTAAAGTLEGSLGAPTVIALGGVSILICTVAVLALPEVRQLRRAVAPPPAMVGGELPWASEELSATRSARPCQRRCAAPRGWSLTRQDTRPSTCETLLVVSPPRPSPSYDHSALEYRAGARRRQPRVSPHRSWPPSMPRCAR